MAVTVCIFCGGAKWSGEEHVCKVKTEENKKDKK